LNKYQELWRRIIQRALEAERDQTSERSHGPELAAPVAETPPRPELGDLAFPMFPFARLLRRPPAGWTVTLTFKGAPPRDE